MLTWLQKVVQGVHDDSVETSIKMKRVTLTLLVRSKIMLCLSYKAKIGTVFQHNDIVN
jgi:hypothetical protein